MTIFALGYNTIMQRYEMKLNSTHITDLLTQINDRMSELLTEAVISEADAEGQFYCPSGLIMVTLSSFKNSVQVFHSDNEHRSPNLERVIEDSLPDYQLALEEAEYEAEQEREHLDYLWRESRNW